MAAVTLETLKNAHRTALIEAGRCKRGDHRAFWQNEAAWFRRMYVRRRRQLIAQLP